MEELMEQMVPTEEIKTKIIVSTEEIAGGQVNNNPKTARFRDAEWYLPKQPVIVGGAGGIGSYLIFFLARQEAIIHLFEFDTIENHNLGGQMYTNTSIGKTKSNEIQRIVKEFTTGEVLQYGKYEEDSLIDSIVFSSFDNMAIRKLMFNKWKNYEHREIFIDGRMSAESIEVYAVTKNNEELYEKTLFDDSEIEDGPCNFKATSHCGAIIAGLMVSVYNNYLVNKKHNADAREVPFKISFQLPLLKFDMSNGKDT